MTPEFAQAVDRVFLSVLGTLEQIGRGEEPEPKEEKLRIRGWLDQAEAQLAQGKDWELAKYGLVSWIDEMMISTPWEGARWWNENKIETELYNTNDRAWKFYQQAKEAFTRKNRDPLEVYYVSVVLGFRGLYGDDPVKAAENAMALGLPPDLETWAREASMSIQLGQGRPPISDASQPIEGAGPLEGPAMFVWSTFAGLVLTVFLVMFLWLFWEWK
jgi:type VI secretion system protein ImpK